MTEVSGFVKSNPIIMDGKYAEVVYREYIKSAVSGARWTIVGDAGSSEGSE